MVIQQQIMSTVHQQKLRQFSAQAANIVTINNSGNVLGIEAEKLGLSSNLNLHTKEQKLIQEIIPSLNNPESAIKKRRYNKHHVSDKSIKTVRQQQRLHKTSHRQYVQEHQQKVAKYSFNNSSNENEASYNNIECYQQQQKQSDQNYSNNFQTQEQQILSQNQINSSDLMASTISSFIPG